MTPTDIKVANDKVMKAERIALHPTCQDKCYNCGCSFDQGTVKNKFPKRPLVILLKDENAFKFACSNCVNDLSSAEISLLCTKSEYDSNFIGIKSIDLNSLKENMS